jgi:hypothetical protein
MNYPVKEVERRGTLANCQAPGFNKPQRSGLIRTCPERSTGSKPLEDVSLIGVSRSILKRVLRGILKRRLDRTARVTGFSFSRLAYIEHEHRSHRFFRSIHAAFVWSSAQGNQVTRPGHCARPDTFKPPGHFCRPIRRVAAHIHTHDRTEGLSRSNSPNTRLFHPSPPESFW